MIKCAISTCKETVWASTPFCFAHSMRHIERSLRAPEREALAERIDQILKILTYREREIIKLRFGIGDGYTYTLEEIGRIFKVSRERVRLVEIKALHKLRHPVRAQKLADLLGLDVVGIDAPESGIIEVVHKCDAELMRHLAKHPDDIWKVTSDRFERIIAEIMHGFGYEVELTQKTRDGGKDIIAVKKDNLGVPTRYIVECKRYSPSRPIRVEMVRALYGVKQEQRADHAILATTSYFTQDAVKFCRSPAVWNLHPRDFDAIKEWMKLYVETAPRSPALL